MYHIELFGLPGSGKSSIIAGLTEKRRDNNNLNNTAQALISAFKNSAISTINKTLFSFTPYTVQQKYIYSLFRKSRYYNTYLNKFLAEHGKCLVPFFSSELFTKISKEEKLFLISNFNHRATLYKMIRENIQDSAPVIFDEGFVQGSSSLFLSPVISIPEFPESEIIDYLIEIPLPELIVYLDTDIEICIERIKARPKSLPQRFEKEAASYKLQDYLANIKDHFTFVLENIETMGCKVIRFDNNEGIAASLECLLKDITAIIDQKN